MPSRSAKKSAYYSQQWCYLHWLEFGDHPERTCEWCRQAFKSGKPQARFCSDYCGNASYRHRMTGGKKREWRKLTEDDVRAIVAAFNAGQRDTKALAEQFGCDASNIRSILKGKTWAHLALDLPDPALISDRTGDRHWSTRHPDRVRSGESHPRAGGKLTAEQVQEIRRRYKAGGVTQKQLAEEFGVGLLAINQICTGKSWTHLPET